MGGWGDADAGGGDWGISEGGGGCGDWVLDAAGISAAGVCDGVGADAGGVAAAQEGVQSVSAQTYPRIPESIKVMERCGMSFVGEGDDVGTVRYRRMR